MATFKDTIAAMKAACKPGDIPAISRATGFSEPTVRKLFTRETAFQLTAAEQKIWQYCNTYFAPRFRDANEIERQATQLMES